MTIDLAPMKCADLKSEIAWGQPDRFARLSRFFSPAYVVEPKWDGVRVRLILGSEVNQLITGRLSTVTFTYPDKADNFPHLRDAVVPELAGTILDAELLMPAGTSIDLGGGKGFTSGPLNTIMSVLGTNPATAHARQAQHGQAILNVFDCIVLGDKSLLDVPGNVRREVTEHVLGMIDVSTIQLVPQYEASADRLDWLLDQGYEGGIIKRVAARYQPGKRSQDWLKVKRMSTGDFFIVGSTPGKGKNDGKVGSLMLAYQADDGSAVYTADMRGFDDATCDMLTDQATGGVKAEWMGRVVEVMAQGRTKNNRLRHPNFVRWRPDKSAADCGFDQLLLFDEV